MTEAKVTIQVRKVSETVSVIDIQGELTSFGEAALMNAYAAASTSTTTAIVLNFSQMGYMNSSGIGLIVTLLVRVSRQKQRLIAYGLSEHYQHIFQLTRLNDAIQILDTENEALNAIAKTPGSGPQSGRLSFFRRK